MRRCSPTWRPSPESPVSWRNARTPQRATAGARAERRHNEVSCRASRFLDHELVHGREQAGTLKLELVPAREVGHVGIIGIRRAVKCQHARIDLESEELEVLLR